MEVITSNGFNVSTLKMRKLDVKLAANYMEAYKFLPDYEEIVKELASDVCVLLEITMSEGKPAVDAFKKLCGPYDPLFAKKI